MCIICLKQEGIEDFTDKILENCWKKNSDGAGFAWFDSKTELWKVKKGFLKYDEFIKEYRGMKFKKAGCVIVHFRIGTSGLNDGGNTHPFPVCDDLEKMRVMEFESEMIAFHNGVVGKGSKIYSDTMEYIADCLFPISPLWDDKRISGAIAETILTKGSSRWIVARGNKFWQYGTWHKYNGWEFSNFNYESYKDAVYTAYNGTGFYSDDKSASKRDAKFLEAKSLGLPKNKVWTHGFSGTFAGFWSGGTFCSWEKYVEDKRKELGLQSNNISIAYDPTFDTTIASQADFDKKFIIQTVKVGGGTANFINWHQFSIFVNALRVAKFKKNKQEKNENQMGAVVDDQGNLIWEDGKVEEQMKAELDKFKMCPNCYDNGFLVKSNFSVGTHLCNRCGCVFTLETGEIHQYDHDINKKFRTVSN